MIRIALAALLLAAPASAQDVATDFATATTLFTPYPDGETQMTLEGAADLIRSIEGTYIQGGFFLDDGVYDADMVAQACTRRTDVIARSGVFNFTLTGHRDGEPTTATVNYAWVGGTTFTRSAPLVGQIEALYGEDWQDAPGTLLAGIMQNPTLHGYGIVHRVGDSIVVIEDVIGRPQILIRCPAP